MKRIEIIFWLLIFIIQTGFTRSVNKLPVERISVEFDSTKTIIPGTEVKLGIAIYVYEYEKRLTRGLLNGNVGWKNFNIECTGADYKKGKIIIPYDAYLIHRGEIYIKANLKKKPAIMASKIIPLNFETDIGIFPAKMFYKVPGEKIPLIFESKFDNNQVLSTSKYALNKINPMHYNVKAFGGNYRNGTFTITENVMEIVNHEVGVEVSPFTNPELTREFIVNLDYRKYFKYNSFGSNGFDGRNGSSGLSGFVYGNGKDGDDGRPGEHGDNGPDLNVYIDSYFDSIVQSDLLRIIIEKRNSIEEKRYLVNTDGGKITISTYGGNGGDGGDGGDGGNGADGADGRKYTVKEKINDSTEVEKEMQEPGYPGGNGGYGGYGANGGDGGNGGNINVYYTPHTERYLYLTEFKSIPGDGGSAGSAGDGGRGGSGGKGNPNGPSGSSGSNGGRGFSGYCGNEGQIEYFYIDDISW